MMKLIVERIMPIVIVSFCYVLSLYYLNSIEDKIIYGIPWGTVLCLMAYLFIDDVFWHLLYLSLTCYYLILKLSYINRLIKSSETVNDAFKQAQKLNSLHIEIHACNRQFWSTHIADSLIQFMFMVNFIIYSVLFNVGMIFFLRMFFIYFAFLYFVMFSLFILIPSFVAYEASKSYRLFHQLYLRLNHKRNRKLPILKMMKVKHMNYLILLKNHNYYLQYINIMFHQFLRCLTSPPTFPQVEFLFHFTLCLISNFKLMLM